MERYQLEGSYITMELKGIRMGRVYQIHLAKDRDK
jgi:hypothetical protein